MIETGRLAFANARIRALKSRLLGPDAAVRLRALNISPDPSAWFGSLNASKPSELLTALFARLVDAYQRVLQSYPIGREVFLALLRRHEIENIKLSGRTCARHRIDSEWEAYWRPLGQLETIGRDVCREARSLAELVTVLRGTPYAAIVD